MKDAAVVLLSRGWSVEKIREYLRSNYIDATMSAVEDAIRFAQQAARPAVELIDIGDGCKAHPVILAAILPDDE